jgi:hypothetical protein
VRSKLRSPETTSRLTSKTVLHFAIPPNGSVALYASAAISRLEITGSIDESSVDSDAAMTAAKGRARMKATMATRRVNTATLLLGFALFAGACGHSTPAGPTGSATTPILPLLSITGQVTDSMIAAPISGATVTLSAPAGYATTDSKGSYTLILPIQYARGGLFWVSANNYEPDYRYYLAATQNFHLYPIIRIAAGDSTSVTIAATDTLCINNVQDSPPWNQVRRSVRVVTASDGILTLEALPASARRALVLKWKPPSRLRIPVDEPGLPRRHRRNGGDRQHRNGGEFRHESVVHADHVDGGTVSAGRSQNVRCGSTVVIRST